MLCLARLHSHSFSWALLILLVVGTLPAPRRILLRINQRMPRAGIAYYLYANLGGNSRITEPGHPILQVHRADAASKRTIRLRSRLQSTPLIATSESSNPLGDLSRLGADANYSRTFEGHPSSHVSASRPPFMPPSQSPNSSMYNAVIVTRLDILELLSLRPSLRTFFQPADLEGSRREERYNKSLQSTIRANEAQLGRRLRASQSGRQRRSVNVKRRANSNANWEDSIVAARKGKRKCVCASMNRAPAKYL